MSTYKEEHEKFFTGLTGSTMSEVAQILLVTPVRPPSKCVFKRCILWFYLDGNSVHYVGELTSLQLSVLFHRMAAPVLFGAVHDERRWLSRFIFDFVSVILPAFITFIADDPMLRWAVLATLILLSCLFGFLSYMYTQFCF